MNLNSKLALIVLCWGMVNCSSFAQNDFVEKRTSSQFGLNTTDFISRIIGTQNRPDTGPIGLFYKLCGPKAKLRIGTGFSGRKTKSDVDDPNGIRTNLTFHSFSFLVGFQKNIIQGNRFGAYWGIDMVDIYSSDLVVNSFFGEETQLKTNSNSFGLGPVLGVTFKISEHFHLNTESTIYMLYNDTKEREAFEGQDIDEMDPEVRTGIEYNLQTPLALFLNYTF